MAVSGNQAPRGQGDKIDPARAAAAVTRWRRAVAEAMGQDPGATLDQPDRRLVMLRVFGATRRLAELCMTYPAAAAAALIDGPSPVLAETARDLAALDRGVGGPEALHAALAPLKNRADIAIALAELGGQWTVPEATAARVDFAERLVETGLQWLVRAAVKRGELTVEDADNIMRGVFIVAGGDFAHEDLSPYGPLELIILYDDNVFSAAKARGADRIFVRIGAELREAFEGKPGEYSLFALRTPLGSGVGGAGYADCVSRVRKTAEGPQSNVLKAWLATARIVAGDRVSGGAFLEGIEELVWGETPILNDDLREVLEKEDDDPRAVFRRVADLCRLAIGGGRPIFRTASAGEIFEIAARSRAFTQDAARRLIAGEELAHIAVSRAQMMKGLAAMEVTRSDEQNALAALCGYSAYDALSVVLDGARIDARNTLRRMTRGPQEEVTLYREGGEDAEDADKLEDLGFRNGATLSTAVDGWARQADAGSEMRFSSHAPGLLTEFGETQDPNCAVRLFDALLSNAQDQSDVFALVREGAPQRDPLVNAFGCFGAAVAPLAENAECVEAFFEKPGIETPQSGREWLSRFPPPALNKTSSLDEIAEWRKQTIARIALSAASGATSFDAAADALDKIHIRTLTDVFGYACDTAPSEERGAGKKIALHVFDGAGGRLPGSATHLGFIAAEPLGPAGEAFARRYLDMLSNLGDGLFAITPDLSHRPSGVTGAIAPDVDTFKSYVLSEAIAHEQIMLARARVIAGADKVTETARDTLRGAVSGARRADILFRDLDRARAQRIRRERPTSDWDIDRLEGGRLDVELVISTLIYKHAAAHPFVQETDANEALDAMARSGLLPEEAAIALKSAREFWARMQVVRALGQWSDPISTPVRRRFGKMIATAAGVEKFEQVRPLIRGYSDDITRLYAQLVLGRPSLSVVAQAAG
jgi:[glutamine synthetase] adenylyltransferase / [glutamine synthetase]-adenylyl-L-tyrosine phosphorylase